MAKQGKNTKNIDLESSLKAEETPRKPTSQVRTFYLGPSGTVETTPTSQEERANWNRDNYDPP